eukprot:4129950-Lingulodinium_polyedra.AAC.1
MFGPRAGRANVRFANRCDGETNFVKRCAMMKLHRRFAAATARASHTRVLHARANLLRAHGLHE